MADGAGRGRPSATTSEAGARVLGLIVPDASNPFYGTLTRLIEDEAFARGYTVLVGSAMESRGRETAYIRTLLSKRVSALLVAPLSGPKDWIDDVLASKIPFILLDRELDHDQLWQFVTDNETGAYDAVRHLIDHGRRRIACIAGPPGVRTTEDRVAGWRRALADEGLDHRSMPLIHGMFNKRDGYEQGKAIMAHSGPPDALFVTSDDQAVGALRAAAERGITVPDDLAVVGFDGTPAAAFSIPTLTTLEQPLELIVRLGVQQALVRTITANLPAPRVVRLPGRLILRESCGCEQPRARTYDEDLVSVASSLPDPRLATLSARDRDVLALTAEGYNDRAVASLLMLDPEAVAACLKNVYRVLGLLADVDVDRRVKAVLAWLAASL